MPFTKRRGFQNLYRNLKSKKIKKLSISTPNNKRIRSNSNDSVSLKTNSQIRTMGYLNKRKNQVVEDRIDKSTGNLKMPCWITGVCDD